VVAADRVSVKRFFGFTEWPEAVAHVDLGQRLIDVLPAPGHQDSHIVFYDNNTTLLFSGDFLMPGRLLIEDKTAFRKSAARLASYFEKRPLAYILGGHIELNADGKTYAFGSHYHPNEHRLELSREDLLALPRDLERFRVYQRYPNFSLFSANLEIILAWEKWGP
jgi:glyoxylase-like metal-dependent hydrolase (beta-lactamase superfamily II)